MPDDKSSPPAQREIRVLEIMGCFLMFFGILLLIAVALAETVSAVVTNLVAALITLVVGGGMFFRGVVRHRGAWRLPVVLFASLAAVAAIVALCLCPSLREARGQAYARFVEALRCAGFGMRNVVQSIPLRWVKLLTVIGFAAIAGVVWLVGRETIFEGAGDRKWWRDLRLWTAVIMVTQVVIYILLGT
jgi:hypothetical protein